MDHTSRVYYWSGVLLIFSLVMTSGCLTSEVKPGSNDEPISNDDYMPSISCQDCNVVIISVDTLRADHLGCYGYHRDTSPSIDSFAKESILFKNVYAVRGQTWPSLTSMLTSLYPVSSRVRWNLHMLNTKVDTLGGLLKNEDYITSAFLSNFCEAKRYDFDTDYCSERDDSKITPKVVEWLGKNKDKKFFTWIHYFNPHEPYNAPEEFDIFVDKKYKTKHTTNYRGLNKIGKQAIKLSKKDIDYFISKYDGDIRFVDSEIKKVFESLKNNGLLDNTIIVFTSDHGEELYERGYYIGHSCSIHDSVLHIPLLIRLPENIESGRQVGEIIENIDIAPTLLDLLGVDKPDTFEGRSFIRLIDPNAIDNSFSYSLSEVGSKIHSIRTERYRYIYNPGNITPNFRKQGCLPRGKNYKIHNEELYDIITDPGEKNNLAEKNPGLALELRRRIDALYPKDSREKYQLADNDSIQKLKALGYLT